MGPHRRDPRTRRLDACRRARVDGRACTSDARADRRRARAPVDPGRCCNGAGVRRRLAGSWARCPPRRRVSRSMRCCWWRCASSAWLRPGTTCAPSTPARRPHYRPTPYNHVNVRAGGEKPGACRYFLAGGDRRRRPVRPTPRGASTWCRSRGFARSRIRARPGRSRSVSGRSPRSVQPAAARRGSPSACSEAHALVRRAACGRPARLQRLRPEARRCPFGAGRLLGNGARAGGAARSRAAGTARAARAAGAPEEGTSPPA